MYITTKKWFEQKFQAWTWCRWPIFTSMSSFCVIPSQKYENCSKPVGLELYIVSILRRNSEQITRKYSSNLSAKHIIWNGSNQSGMSNEWFHRTLFFAYKGGVIHMITPQCRSGCSRTVCFLEYKALEYCPFRIKLTYLQNKYPGKNVFCMYHAS